jgi:hypothetical protein
MVNQSVITVGIKLLPPCHEKTPQKGTPATPRRLEDGVVIYSVGPDEVDYGGKLDRHLSSILKPASLGIGKDGIDCSRQCLVRRSPILVG